MIKEAAQRLLDRGEITKEEFEVMSGLTKEALFGLTALGEGGKSVLGSTGSVARDILQTLGLAAVAGTLGSALVNKATAMHEHATAYENMTKKMPILSEYPEQEVRDYYNVVKTFSPKAASNPLVAAALVNKMIQFGGVDHKLVQDIANIEGPHKNIYEEIVSKAGTSLGAFPKDGSEA